MNKKDIKNRNIEELMSLLLDKGILEKDKLKINRMVYRKLNNDSNRTNNWDSLRKYFRNLKEDVNIESYLSDKDIPKYVKKYILEYGFNDEELRTLLKKSIDYDLKEYIVKDLLNASYEVVRILKDDMIDDSLRKLCVKGIKNYKIINVLLNDEIDDQCREYILATEKRRFIKELYRTSNADLVYTLSFDYYNYDNVSFIEKYKPNLLKNTSSCITNRYIRNVYDRTFKNEALISTMLEGNEQKINKIINDVRKEESIRFLEVKNLPQEYVKNIINNNIKYLKEYINKLSIDKVIEKLHNYSDLCFEYKELIVTYRLDDLINKLNNGSVNKYFEYISLYHYTDELIINTIDKKIFDDGVIDLLNNNHYNNDIINFILKYKSEYIKNILVNIDFDNLIYNKNKTDKYFDIINSLPKNIQNKIYKRNSIYIREVLSKYDNNVLKEFLNSDDNNKNTYINRIKDIFFNNIITYNSDYFDNIGNISLLKILQKDNIDNKEIFYLTEEIITSMDIINKLATTNDRDELVKIIISYIDGEDTPINRMINDIIDIKSKIRRLYELDSMYNLTTLESARKVPGIYNKEYMELYGGEVFDFSDKNYVLYAHVVSSRENIEDLVNGYSSGNSNFISFSPISYRGQKYYYDYCDCILAYDTIYDNSFICSSLSNMGSNHCMIEKNSAVVADKYRNQRGILETSSVKKQNAETLLYREGLKPCGIILANGKRPNSDEIMYHKRYNLPFIITQKKETAIDNPKRVFTSGNGKYVSDSRVKELDSIKKYIASKLTIKKENDIYTGREIAIFTDTHAMYEPTIAILEDIRFRGISEIYSLGDNTSLGPNPREVLDLMDKYNVNQIMGNSEYYLTLGGSPFNYWSEERERSLDWTNDRVQGYINNLKLYKPSLDLLLGGKKIALCHFGNDIRWDFVKHNTWIYQDNIGNGKSADQFMFTNGDEYNKEVEYMINKYGIDNPKVQGYLSSRNTPMFDGKLITSYDDVFQGHVHFELEDRLNNTNIHTLRGAGMGEYEKNKKSMAYYVILKEKKIGGYDIEKVYVPFNKNSLFSSIYSSDMPTKAKILGYLK